MAGRLYDISPALLDAPDEAGPVLLREPEPRHRQFLGTLSYVLGRKEPLPADEATFWRDVFVPSRLPWTTFIESLVYHALVLVALIAWARWAPPRLITQEDPWKESRVIVYPATAAQAVLPRLDTGSAGQHRPQTGDPTYARQPIISVPSEPDNRAQTIVTPPDIVLHRDVRLPNVVAWASLSTTALPTAPTPAVPVLASERTLVAPQLSVVAPAPQVVAAHRSSPVLPQAAVVAPPPELQNQFLHIQVPPRDQPTLAASVVPPPPQVESATNRLGTMSLGRSEVVAPAPQLPVSEQRTLSQAGRQAGQALSAGAVPPPPLISSSGTQGSGRMIALSMNPSAPANLQPPAGNRRGEFSATPQGSTKGSGRPAIQDSGATRNASTGGSSTVPGLPPGIRIGDPSTSQPDGTGTESLASINIDRHPIPSIPPPRVATSNRKPAKLSDHTPTETERKVFGPRRFYSMMLSMPNLNSAGGTWIVRFAELKASSTQGELYSPLLTLKSDPAYPSELQRANIQGTVTLYAIIHTDGTVRDVRVLDGADERLDQFAKEALARCHFEPAVKDGVPVALEAVVAIPFRARKEF